MNNLRVVPVLPSLSCVMPKITKGKNFHAKSWGQKSAFCAQDFLYPIFLAVFFNVMYGVHIVIKVMKQTGAGPLLHKMCNFLTLQRESGNSA